MEGDWKIKKRYIGSGVFTSCERWKLMEVNGVFFFLDLGELNWEFFLFLILFLLLCWESNVARVK